MTGFSKRSPGPELIDSPDIPFQHWAKCLKELDFINTWLGGHAITIDGLSTILKLTSLQDRKAPVTIAEIGCGGGDNLKAIHRWNQTRKWSFRYVGIDLNKACTDYAAENCRDLPDARFIHSDYRDAVFQEGKPDIVFSSLFCHHFRDEDIAEMLRWMKANANAGFFINDLQRHPIAYYSIKALTTLFSRSYLIRHDAPLSVQRGFIKKDWHKLLSMANFDNYSVQWKWAFRYLITVRHE